MQVPIAVLMDALFRDPGWKHSAWGAALTFAGGAVVLLGFFGIVWGGGGEAEGRADARWEASHVQLERELEVEGGEGEEERFDAAVGLRDERG